MEHHHKTETYKHLQAVSQDSIWHWWGLPCGNQKWLAGNSPICSMSFPWAPPCTGMFHCHLWLPESQTPLSKWFYPNSESSIPFPHWAANLINKPPSNHLMNWKTERHHENHIVMSPSPNPPKWIMFNTSSTHFLKNITKFPLSLEDTKKYRICQKKCDKPIPLYPPNRFIFCKSWTKITQNIRDRTDSSAINPPSI